MPKVYDSVIETSGSVVRHCITCDGVPVTYSEVLDLWQHDDRFVDHFLSLLVDSPLGAYRWETPALALGSASRAFEFVLVPAPSFEARPTDRESYRSYFTDDPADDGVVSFANLGGDATLVVPSPRGPDETYGHLAAFVRRAPKEQVRSLWRRVGQVASECLGASPIWINTAGGGVAWLHVRLDRRPKYYGHAAYKAR